MKIRTVKLKLVSTSHTLTVALHVKDTGSDNKLVITAGYLKDILNSNVCEMYLA
jgi:hypothetical protein